MAKSGGEMAAQKWEAIFQVLKMRQLKSVNEKSPIHRNNLDFQQS